MGVSDANFCSSHYTNNLMHRRSLPTVSSTNMLDNNLLSLSACSLPPSPASTPTTSTHSVKRRKTCSRNVSFHHSDELAYIESAADLTQVERDCRWYQADELQEIKSAARRLCVQEAKGGLGSSSISEQKESTRGMDVYYPSRQRNNRKFVEHVLEAYHFRCHGNAEHVRQLVERWSIKSRERASLRAQQDYLEAYQA